MELLNNELLDALMSYDETFVEGNHRTRLAFWTGEEWSESGLKRNFKEANLGRHEQELMRLRRKGILETCLDDGWLHLTFPNEVLGIDFLSKVAGGWES